MKDWNCKTKAEQLFLLCLIFIFTLGILCITGCKGSSCEKIKCGSEELSGAMVMGVSLPGCGGCVTPGRGCNTYVWAQSCKFVSLSTTENDDSEENESIKGCDIRYYDGGCLGCGQKEKSCYFGCIKLDSEDETMNGVIYGTSNSSEKYIGCIGDCGGCVGTGGVGKEYLQQIEYMTGVE